MISNQAIFKCWKELLIAFYSSFTLLLQIPFMFVFHSFVRTKSTSSRGFFLQSTFPFKRVFKTKKTLKFVVVVALPSPPRRASASAVSRRPHGAPSARRSSARCPGSPSTPAKGQTYSSVRCTVSSSIPATGYTFSSARCFGSLSTTNMRQTYRCPWKNVNRWWIWLLPKNWIVIHHSYI